MPTTHRPTLAVWKFASCDGCQLTLLNCEAELLSVLGAVEVALFPEATSTARPGPYDISLVEGSITTPEDAERIQRVRAVSRHLVTIGACATAGGVQAMRDAVDHDELAASVYPHPDFLSTLARSTPVAAHVSVDTELRGCPVDRGQLLEVLAALVQHRRPRLPTASVCHECKHRGVVCLTVARGVPCLGPVTQAGCGALCPAHDRGCYGCFGPQDTANTAGLGRRLAELGLSDEAIVHRFRGVAAGAVPFREEAVRREAST